MLNAQYLEESSETASHLRLGREQCWRWTWLWLICSDPPSCSGSAAKRWDLYRAYIRGAEIGQAVKLWFRASCNSAMNARWHVRTTAKSAPTRQKPHNALFTGQHMTNSRTPVLFTNQDSASLWGCSDYRTQAASGIRSVSNKPCMLFLYRMSSCSENCTPPKQVWVKPKIIL